MENINITDNQLLDYLDGVGTEVERKGLKEAITNSPLAQRRLKELETVHFFLQNKKGMEQPSKNFTDKVMEHLHAKASFTLVLSESGPDGREFTTLVPVEVVGRRAEAAGELEAGALVVCEGKIGKRKRSESWELIVTAFDAQPLRLPAPAPVD